MRYIGSKEKILSFIDDTVTDVVGDISGSVVGDLFSGTTSVSRLFKKKEAILITNDYMAFSYAFQIASIKCNKIPDYYELSSYFKFSSIYDILNYLTSVKQVKDGFFYREYCKEGSIYKRNYFSKENAILIDSIRTEIQNWKNKDLINNDEFYYLISILVDAVTRVSNISGTYGAFLKIDDNRKLKRLELVPREVIKSPYEHSCHCENIFDIIDTVCGDILYLDPPYNTRQYPPYYHILETVTLYDNPQIYGKTGRRPYNHMISPFCLKNEAKDALLNVIKRAKFKHIFISYSTDGIIQIDNLITSLSGIYKVEKFDNLYRRYKSNSNGEKKNELKEIIIYVRK